MLFSYKTQGTCASQIEFDLSDGIVSNLHFRGGCNGNLQGIARLAEGARAVDLIERLEGVRCGFKNTSCPDQLARALKAALAEENG